MKVSAQLASRLTGSLAFVVVALPTALVAGGCSKTMSNLDDPGAGGGGGGAGDGAGGTSSDVDAGHRRDAASDPDAQVRCVNLQCQQLSCTGGAHTTVSGTVYAPNGTLPLYNAMVYVPNAPVPALPTGLSCDRCGVLPAGSPLVGALTDTHGAFTLKDVPVGTNIPLVIQVGKWRRQVTIPSVKACVDNPLTDPDMTRLPRKRSEGDMPRMAITTGACDDLICLMEKLGIDPSEWGVAGEGAALTFYEGTKTALPVGEFDSHLGKMTGAADLFGDLAQLEKYDMVIASCECSEPTVPAGAYQAMTDYLAEGGRLFSTDLQYVWYKNSTDPNLSGAVQINPDILDKQNLDTGLSPIGLDASFPKGQALVDWLAFLDPQAPRASVGSQVVGVDFVGVTQPAWQIWGRSASTMAPSTSRPRFLSANMPAGLPAEQQCGRAVHLDAHISVIPLDVFPASCGTDLKEGEPVMAFFLFDAAACIQDDTLPPPPIVP
jgi:hypothetical protein